MILKFCLNFGNKNTEILLQFSGKRLTTRIIHNFSFTTHNYRMSALQIQSCYKYYIFVYYSSIPKRGNKIQNFVGGNNQFEKCFWQKLEKCFIDIKILPRFTKPSVAVTLYKNSAKVYLILAQFIILNVHIDESK